MIRPRQTRLLFVVSVARDALAQQFVRAAQAVGDGAHHLQRHVHIAAHEGEKIFAREHGEPRFFGDGGMRRAGFAVNNRHLAEEVSGGKFRERHIFAVAVVDVDANAPRFDQKHRVADIAHFEQQRARRNIAHDEQVAQRRRRRIIQTIEQRHGTQSLKRQHRESFFLHNDHLEKK
jgi:hypothetical protein